MIKRTKQRKKIVDSNKKFQFEEFIANQEDFEGLVKKLTSKPEDEQSKKKVEVKSDVVKV